MMNKAKVRENVIVALPEAKDITNKDLREKVYDAWALSLVDSGYEKIQDLPGSGLPDLPSIKNSTQVEHLRGVARIALAIAREIKTMFPDFDIDFDEVIASGLCHDLGKPFEYSSKNRKRWGENTGLYGFPAFRHSVYGAHIALSAGLPETVAHAIGAHSKEGSHLTRSVVGALIHYADVVFWGILDKALILTDRMPPEMQAQLAHG
jgi:putative nucleotidyltransferase with HDIG domain